MNRVTYCSISLLSSVVLLTAAVDCRAALIAGTSVTEDFNANVNNWVLAKDASEVGAAFVQSATEGTDTPASGGAVFSGFSNSNGTNDGNAIYAPGGALANGVINLDPGDTINLSVSYQVLDPNQASTPRLGIVANDSFFDLTNADNLVSSSRNTIGALVQQGATKRLTLRSNEEPAGVVNNQFSTEPNISTAADEWYTINLSIQKSFTADEFDVTASLDLLNADGTAVVTADLLTASFTYNNATVYAEDEFYAGFHYSRAGNGQAHAEEFDNFSLSITSAPIPEPTSLMLVGVPGIGFVSCMRRRRSRCS